MSPIPENDEAARRRAWERLPVDSYKIPDPYELRPKQKWAHTAVIYVPPFTPFPIDMLRYDQCWPRTGEDAAKMNLTLGGGRIGYEEPLAIFVTRHHDEKRRPGWEPRRWRSFGVMLQAANESPPVEVHRLAAGIQRSKK